MLIRMGMGNSNGLYSSYLDRVGYVACGLVGGRERRHVGEGRPARALVHVVPASIEKFDDRVQPDLLLFSPW